MSALFEHLSWMSPPLGLALAASLVVALAYAVLALLPWRLVPLCWVLALAGLAGGQAIAGGGLRFFQVGDFALGTGLLMCALLFSALHLLRLWYTKARQATRRASHATPRRERMRR